MILYSFLILSFFDLLICCVAAKGKVSFENSGETLELENVFASDLDFYTPLRVCYFTTWARYRSPPFSHLPRDVDPRLCSHIIVAFLWIKDGNLTLHSETEDKRIIRGLLSWKRTHPNLKILGAVGGWTFGNIPFRWVVGSARNRTRFVRSSLELMEKWNLDGLDLDWEYPQWKERDNFTRLIQELRDAFVLYGLMNETEPFLLTAAVPCAIRRLGGYDIPNLAKSFDFVNVMSYDLNGPWANVTGHNAPLHSYDGNNVANGVKEWLRRGMPRRKVMLGLPLYGHSFELKNRGIVEAGGVSIRGVNGPITNSPGFFSYYEVCDFLATNGTEMYWDSQGVVPYAVNDNIWLSFDNEASLMRKVRWAQNENLGGIMVWSLALDDFTGLICRENVTYPLLKAINLALGFNVSQIDSYGAEEIKNVVESDKKRYMIWPKAKSRSQSLGRSNGAENGGNPTDSSDGENCDWDHIPRPGKDCRHFTVCALGKLRTFLCPSGLVFSPENAICMWGWEVPECSEEAEHPDTTTEGPTTPKPEIEVPKKRVIILGDDS